MSKQTVIITAGTSARSQSLARNYEQYHVVFADYMPIPSPMLSSGRFVQLPDVKAAHFIHELLKVCLDREAAMLVLQTPEEAEALAGQQLLFEEYNIEVVC
jgi:hypothetical protein